VIVIRFKVHGQPEKVDEALAAFAAVVVPSRGVDGVISFDVARDIVDANAIVAVEVFEDDAARERQESLPEVGRIMALLPGILTAPPEATVFQVSASVDAFASA
jgi:quinol monooxygenase YgiN